MGFSDILSSLFGGKGTYPHISEVLGYRQLGKSSYLFVLSLAWECRQTRKIFLKHFVFPSVPNAVSDAFSVDEKIQRVEFQNRIFVLYESEHHIFT